jgi:hypothetical protein
MGLHIRMCRQNVKILYAARFAEGKEPVAWHKNILMRFLRSQGAQKIAIHEVHKYIIG